MKNRFVFHLVFSTIAIGMIMLSSCTNMQQAYPTALISTETSTQPLPTLTSSPTQTITPTATETPIPTPTATAITYGPDDFPANINPLTGLEVDDLDLLERRPVMIKVSNFPRESRPQAGLSSADIVFDYSIGEGSNRFLALYYGQDSSLVGPIRSGRLVDAQLVRLYSGILGYAGADPSLVNPVLIRSLDKRAISKSTSTCPALCDQGPSTVYSVFANTSLLSDYAINQLGTGKSRYDLNGMVFNSTPPNDGIPGDQIVVLFNFYNRGEWQYDPSSGNYLRFIEEVDEYNNLKMIPLLDRQNEEQLSFSNIIILFARYNEFAPTLLSIDIWDNLTGQPAFLFRDGQKYQISWKTPGTDQPIQFFQEDGNLIHLKPGTTWISIVGESSKIEETEQGKWNVFFSIP